LDSSAFNYYQWSDSRTTLLEERSVIYEIHYSIYDLGIHHYIQFENETIRIIIKYIFPS
jgi:hypothetical protein